MAALPKSPIPESSLSLIQTHSDSAESDSGKQKKKRVRTKTGCITCRIRRVKCDETRPFCTRCVSTRRKCDGYSLLPIPRHDLSSALSSTKPHLLSSTKPLPPSPPSLLPNPLLNPLPNPLTSTFTTPEALSFSFFLSRTTPATNQLFSSTFWSHSVPQLAHAEPAIKHAVLAISALHQGWDQRGSTLGVDQGERGAVAQYARAVGAARGLVGRCRGGGSREEGDGRNVGGEGRAGVQKVLVACILFICVENLMGDYGSAAMHLGNGLQILEDSAGSGHRLGDGGRGEGFEAEIVELVQRYHFQAMTFAQTRWPYRQASVRFAQGAPGGLPGRFETMGEVRSFLFEKVTWAMCVGEVLLLSMLGVRQHPMKDCGVTMGEARGEQERIVREMHSWRELFEDFCDRETVRTGEEFRESVAYVWLALYYQITYLTTTTGCTGVEYSWDAHTEDFKQILDRCELIIERQISKTPLSLEVGVCIPLFMSAYKCRHPRLRRRAIALLDMDNRKEGIWETYPAARLCERIITLEEKNARRIWRELGEEREILTETDIPEAARCQSVFTEVSLPKKFIKMRYMFRPDGPGTPLEVIEDRVDF